MEERAVDRRPVQCRCTSELFDLCVVAQTRDCPAGRFCFARADHGRRRQHILLGGAAGAPLIKLFELPGLVIVRLRIPAKPVLQRLPHVTTDKRLESLRR